MSRPLRYIDHPLLPESAPLDHPHIVNINAFSEETDKENLRGPDGLVTAIHTHDPNLLSQYLDINGYTNKGHFIFTAFPGPGHLALTIERHGSHSRAVFFRATPEMMGQTIKVYFQYKYDLDVQNEYEWRIHEDGKWEMIMCDMCNNPDLYPDFSRMFAEGLIYNKYGKDMQVFTDYTPSTE